MLFVLVGTELVAACSRIPVVQKRHWDCYAQFAMLFVLVDMELKDSCCADVALMISMDSLQCYSFLLISWNS
jgi:hypothetical protein